jgi:hypothetical protein
MDRNYGGVIWTNHALDRMRQRDIKQGDAWSVWKNPDTSRYSKLRGGWLYERTYGNQSIGVVAKPPVRRTSGPEENRWLILSVWSKPARFKKTKNISLLTKILQKFF